MKIITGPTSTQTKRQGSYIKLAVYKGYVWAGWTRRQEFIAPLLCWPQFEYETFSSSFSILLCINAVSVCRYFRCYGGTVSFVFLQHPFTLPLPTLFFLRLHSQLLFPSLFRNLLYTLYPNLCMSCLWGQSRTFRATNFHLLAACVWDVLAFLSSFLFCPNSPLFLCVYFLLLSHERDSGIEWLSHSACLRHFSPFSSISASLFGQ